MQGKVPTGSYFHYLHHRYFECNYGESTLPLDKWFGTFHDGSENNKGISNKPGRVNETAFTKNLTITVGTLLGLAPLVPLISKSLLQ